MACSRAACSRVASASPGLARSGRRPHAGQDQLVILIHHRNRNIPTAPLAVWARLGYTRRAETLANAIPDNHRRVGALAKVVTASAAAGQTTEAERIANTIDDPRGRANALAEVVTALAAARLTRPNGSPAKPNRPPTPSTTPRAGQTRWPGLAALAAAGQTAEAERIADTIDEPWWRADALAKVVTDRANWIAGQAKIAPRAGNLGGVVTRWASGRTRQHHRRPQGPGDALAEVFGRGRAGHRGLTDHEHHRRAVVRANRCGGRHSAVGGGADPKRLSWWLDVLFQRAALSSLEAGLDR